MPHAPPALAAMIRHAVLGKGFALRHWRVEDASSGMGAVVEAHNEQAAAQKFREDYGSELHVSEVSSDEVAEWQRNPQPWHS